MSLFESLDGFVGTGVLACAGLIGVEIPSSTPLNGMDLSRHLRAHRLGDSFGSALDGLAHAIWMVQEQRGFSQAVSESHALTLTLMLSEIRLDRAELTAAMDDSSQPAASEFAIVSRNAPAARLAAAWLTKAAASGPLEERGLLPDVAGFLLATMFAEIAFPPRLLEELAPTLRSYRDAIAQGDPAPLTIAQDPPQPLPEATSPPASAAASTQVAVRSPNATAVRAPLPGVLETASHQVSHQMPAGALERFQAILAQQPMTAHQRQVRLDELTGWLAATVAYLRRPANVAPAMQRVKAEAAEALQAGDLERAMDLLKSIRERLRDERRGAEARIADELSNLRLTMLDEAAATARLGELAMARMEFATAAEFFADAAGQLPVKEYGLEYDYRQRHAEALAGQAETTGDARVLEAAAQAFRQCRRLLVRERDPGSWVRASVGLGDMLMGLAGCAGSHAEVPLEEAVASFAEAAEVIDHDAKPRQWGLVQMSYATALFEFGRFRDRQRHWKHAASVLMATLAVLEPLGVTELSLSARQKLQQIASGLDADVVPAVPLCQVG